MSEKNLTPKQEQFCQEYLVDLNGTQAALRAGYSENTAAEQASRLLIKSKVVDRIQKLMDARSERVKINSDFILMELYKIASADLSLAYDDKGTLKNIHEIPEHVRKAIAGIEVYQEFEGAGKERYHAGDTTKIKMWDKIKSLELLGKHLEMFTDKVKVSGNIGLAERIAKARKRVGK